MSTMEKLFHMIKLMNFVVDEYDGETFLHNEANAETRKVHIISDERQQHIITKGNKKKDLKIICSACQKFTNILEKILQQTFSLYTNILLDQFEMFLVSNSIFIISKDLVFNICYQTSFQEDQQKNFFKGGG